MPLRAKAISQRFTKTTEDIIPQLTIQAARPKETVSLQKSYGGNFFVFVKRDEIPITS